MASFIVSNRTVRQVDGKERFVNSGDSTAEPTFRVAKLNAKADDYRIVPDFSNLQYSAKVADPKARASSLPGSAQLLHTLYHAMTRTEASADVALVVHGYNYDLDDSLDHIRNLRRLYRLGVKGGPIPHLIYFAWPSGNDLSRGDYRHAQRNATISGGVLRRFLRKMVWGLGDIQGRGSLLGMGQDVHLFAHSMGNRVLSEAVQAWREDEELFATAMLFNADVARDKLEPGKALHVLGEIAGRVAVYVHAQDRVLIASRSRNRRKPRLGRRGPKSLAATPENVVLVDTTDTEVTGSVREGSFNHWGYLEREAVRKDVLQVLAGRSPGSIEHRKPVGSTGRHYALG